MCVSVCVRVSELDSSTVVDRVDRVDTCAHVVPGRQWSTVVDSVDSALDLSTRQVVDRWLTGGRQWSTGRQPGLKACIFRPV